MLNSFNYHMETSAHVPPLRSLIQPLLVILKDDWVDVKAKTVLPHMDHHAHSSSYETQLSESVCVSAISCLSEPASSPQAEQSCIVLQVTHCVSLSHQLPLDLMWFLRVSSFCLTEWRVSQATAGSVGNYWFCSWAFVLDHLSEHITF